MTPAIATTRTADEATTTAETAATQRIEQQVGLLPRDWHELHCLICGRLLAAVVDDEGRQRLLPPPGGVRVLLMRTAAGARCSRCGGYPYLVD